MPPSDRPSRLKPVYMEDVSGRGFEELCQKIFDILGYGDEVELTPQTNDRGKDLIIYQGKEMIYVECRHEPDNAQGRPDIQKLHSCMISEGAKSGIFVTTGRFSKPAAEYANDAIPRIRLIAQEELIGMAKEAGYKLIFESKDEGTVYFYSMSDREEVRLALRDRLWGNVGSDDRLEAPGLLTYMYTPYFRLDYSISAGWVGPYEQKKKGVKPITKGYVLLDASRPAIVEPQGIRAPMKGAMFEEPTIGVPVRNLKVWDPEAARDRNIKFSEFILTYEDAMAIAQRQGRNMAALKDLPVEAVTLRNVHRVMVPTYRYTITTAQGKEMEITALYITKPIILSWGRD